MFGKKEREKNPSYLSDFSNIRYHEEKALDNCSDDIKYLVTDFFKKCSEQKLKSLDSSIIFEVENIASLVCAVAQNTVRGEKISQQDLRYITAIFKEIEALLMQLLRSKTHIYWKIDYLRSFFEQNINYMKLDFTEYDGKVIFLSKKGMIFRNYKNLLIIMHVINEQFHDLEQRGFSDHSVIYPFMEIMKKSTVSEEEKLRLFIGLLNGTMKIQPVFEYKFVEERIVPIDTTGPFITNQAALERKERALRPSTNVLPTDPEGINKMLSKLYATTLSKQEE